MGVFLNPHRCGIEPIVLHLHSAPRLQAQGLARGERDFPQDLKPQVLAPLLLVPTAAALATGDLPDLRKQRAREGLVGLHEIVHVRGEVANRPMAVLDSISHQRPQAEAACVVLHPAGLKRRVLAVVAEHQQALALRVVDHVLRQHMDVSDVNRPHRSGRLAIVAAGSPPTGCPAGQATRQDARVVFPLLHGPKAHRR